MPDNVKTALSLSLLRLLKPLVKIMLREGLTYSHFGAIAQMAFVESAAEDFVGKGMKSSATSVCALTGMTVQEVQAVLTEQERFDSSELLEVSNPFARVLHGWHNDRDYVGPYGFPVDLPFEGSPLSFTNLTARHVAGVSPDSDRFAEDRDAYGPINFEILGPSRHVPGVSDVVHRAPRSPPDWPSSI